MSVPVDYTHAEESGREASECSHGFERRSEPRYPTAGTSTKVTRLDEASEEIKGRIFDISKTGLRFKAEIELPEGARVRLEFGDSIAFGDVRWTRRVEGEVHEVGVQVSHIVNRTLVNNLKKASASAGS